MGFCITQHVVFLEVLDTIYSIRIGYGKRPGKNINKKILFFTVFCKISCNDCEKCEMGFYTTLIIFRL